MSQDVNQLKELLFNEEQHELAVLQQRLENVASEERQARGELQKQIKAIIERASARDLRIKNLYELTGSPDRLRSSVAEILDGALKDVDADQAKSTDLRRAMTPFVASTVAAEIRNNKDTLVQVLSPSLGVMIRDYITSAMNDMMAQINRKLEKAIPGSQRKMRAKAKAAGMTMAEMALAETQKLEVVELYLVRRGSGKVIAHWGRDDLELNPNLDMATAPARSSARMGDNRDALVGGFLSAITEFAKEAFEADKASLRALQIDGFQIFLRHSPAYLMAAKCSGAPLPGIDKAIDAEFLNVMDQHDDLLSQAASNGFSTGSLNGANGEGAQDARPADANLANNGLADEKSTLDDVLPQLAASLEARMSTRHDELFKTDNRKGTNPLKMLLWLVGLPLLVVLGWFGWQNYWTNWTQTKTRSTISSIAPMRGYPINIDVEYGGQGVHVSGLTPSRSVKDRVIAKLTSAMPLVAIDDQLTIIPTPKTVDPGPQIAKVANDLNKHSKSAGKQITQLDARSRKRVTTLEQRNQKRLNALEERNRSEFQGLATSVQLARQALVDLRRANDKRLVDLQLQMTRTAMGRALERAKKRLLSVNSDLQAMTRNSDIDRATSAHIARIAQDAKAAYSQILALEKAMARTSVKPVQLVSDINQLSRKISAIAKLLAAQAGIAIAAPNARTQPTEPTQSAEELALGAERLLMLNNAAARAMQLRPLQVDVGKVSSSVTDLSKDVGKVSSSVTDLSKDVGKVSSTVTDLSKSVGTVTTSVSTLNQRVDDLLPGALDRLESWTRRNAVFFTTEAVFRDPRAASTKLNILSGLIKDTNQLVRVVGYTDDIGTRVRNAPLALARAKKVRDELVSRGVSASHLTIVGRTHGPNLSASKGGNSNNRRVQFEMGFAGERAAGQ